MKKPLFVCLILLISLSLFAELVIYTEISGRAQYYNENGELTGSSIEIVQEIQKRIGDTTEIQVVPWARGYNALESDPEVLLFSTTRTEDREPLFKWVGPVFRLDWAFYVKKGSDITISSLEDAKALERIGTYRDDAREKFLISEGFDNLDSTNNSVLNVTKLLAGRIDAVISSDAGIIASLEDAGYNPDDVQEAYTIRTYELYLSFSKETPDETVEEWHNALKGMYEDGTFEEIYHRYYPGRKLPEFGE